MTLAAEREILKRIHKLNIQRRQVAEFQAQDKEIQIWKSTVSNLRESLKEQREEILGLKVELNTVSTAVDLGCEVKDLLGKKIDCPIEKLGNVIGKKGKNVQSLMSTNRVNVDIARRQGDIRLIGTLGSLDAAVSSLDKVIQQKEENMELPAATHKYLTSSKITALSQLRDRHPDAYFSILRSNGEEAPVTTQIRIRGSPTDIQVFKNDVLGMNIVTSELHLTSRDAGLLVGKAGATIAGLVEGHQTTIDVQRPAKKGETVDAEELTKVTISGPSHNVSAAKAGILAMIEANKDCQVTVSIHPITRHVLLLNNGAGIQALYKKINEATKTARDADDAAFNSGMYAAVTFNDGGIVVAGKANAIHCAVAVVKEEVSRIEFMLTKIEVDPSVIPVIIGKSGQGIKDLKSGSTTVFLDVDRQASLVAVCGLEKGEVDTVIQAVEALKANHQVQRLRLECDEGSATNSFVAQFRHIARSSVMKEVKDLAFMVSDDVTKQIVLRGKPHNVAKAAALINAFVEQNFMEELVVSAEDLSALLTGGKVSKIVDLAASAGVNIRTDRDRNAVIAKGEKEKVIIAMKAVREFLYGSADFAVNKIPLSSGELIGVVIGKGGKNKADLQEKFPSVTIIVHPAEAAITLRGQRQQVEQCTVAIMSLVLSVSISRSTDLSENQLKVVNKTKFNRRIGQIVPVQAILSTEKNNITFRGSSADVHFALSLLKEELEGVFESRLQIGSALFQKLNDACRNPSHVDRIERQSGARVSLECETEYVVLTGKRETVKQAKIDLLTFFDFLFGSNMCRCDIPGLIFALVAKPNFVAEVAATTGAQVIVDRDLSSILIFSSEADKVKKGSTMINAKLSDVKHQVYVLQLEASEDWLVSSIIGKSGNGIKKLRRQTGCSIEIESKERRLIVSANDTELVTKARQFLNELVETSRRECVYISIPQQFMPAFVGRSGSKIREFSEKHEVEVQVMKHQGNAVRITGKEDKVAHAKMDLDEWLRGRAEVQKDAEGERTIRLKANQIPAVIGAKGATIRSLEREFGCKIDIDRKSCIVTVKGGSTGKRVALLEKIDSIIADEPEKLFVDDALMIQPESDSAKEKTPEVKTAKEIERTKKAPPVTQVSAATKSKPPTSASMTDSDFPPLISDNGTGAKESKMAVLAETHWASIASPSRIIDNSQCAELATEENESSSEPTFVGDVIEEPDQDVRTENENVFEEMD